MLWERYLPDNRIQATGGHDSHLIWPSDPDLSIIRDISTSVLSQLAGYNVDNGPLEVQFLGRGANHRVYEVAHDSLPMPYLFRVAIDLDPTLKIESEMATLEFLRQNSSVPVARPLAWDSSANNALGFEWCLVEKIPGVEIRRVWTDMPWNKKVAIVDQFAEIMCQVWHTTLKTSKIGSLYFSKQKATWSNIGVRGWNALKTLGGTIGDSPTITLIDDVCNHGFEVGPIVNLAFYTGRRRYLSPDRGPFKTCYDWVKALIGVEAELTRTAHLLLSSPCDMTEKHKTEPWEALLQDLEVDSNFLEEYNDIVKTCNTYLEVLPYVFPTKDDPNAADDDPQYSLYHWDVSYTNVMVDPETFMVTGVLDWEMISTVPDWYGRQYPSFIDGFEPPASSMPGAFTCDSSERGGIVDDQDPYGEGLLHKRFDKKMKELGWEGWKLRSPTNDVKTRFISSIGKMRRDWKSAREDLDWIVMQRGMEPVDWKSKSPYGSHQQEEVEGSTQVVEGIVSENENISILDKKHDSEDNIKTLDSPDKGSEHGSRDGPLQSIALAGVCLSRIL